MPAQQHMRIGSPTDSVPASHPLAIRTCFKMCEVLLSGLDITPHQHPGGGNERLRQITCQDDGYLQALLVHERS
jgi:hypothetical protein